MLIVIPDLNSTVKWSAKTVIFPMSFFTIYQSLVELCDVGFLLGDKVLQLLDPVHSFFPVVAVELGLFLLVAEPENLIGDGIVVL